MKLQALLLVAVVLANATLGSHISYSQRAVDVREDQQHSVQGKATKNTASTATLSDIVIGPGRAILDFPRIIVLRVIQWIIDMVEYILDHWVQYGGDGMMISMVKMFWESEVKPKLMAYL